MKIAMSIECTMNKAENGFDKKDSRCEMLSLQSKDSNQVHKDAQIIIIFILKVVAVIVNWSWKWSAVVCYYSDCAYLHGYF